MKNKIKIIYLSLVLVISIVMLCSCSGNANDQEEVENVVKEPLKTVVLSEDNIDEYLYFTFIVEPIDYHIYVDEYTTDHHLNQVRYYAHNVTVKFFPKKTNVSFTNCVITLGKTKQLTNGDDFNRTLNYTFPVYIDEKGYGEYENQFFVRQGNIYENDPFTRAYYDIKGKVSIYEE